MDRERWDRVREVLESALERPPDQRAAFLEAACGEDAELRHEVESLLGRAGEAEHFLSVHVDGKRLLSHGARTMSLSSGHKLAHYEILELIGKGGMGEVYRARDTKLGRDVAIKTLTEEFAKDKERLARFEREAKLLASLNHPNIASIYGLVESAGAGFIILELVEGESLAERLRGGRIEVEEALGLARQIADALDAAHERGVIHRDLKPGNIQLTPDGRVKLLDFGLAKELVPEGAGPIASGSPTLGGDLTKEGVVVGTATYMSPEQAQGKPVDKRMDIWAFGCVLFEMLSGRVAFPGQNVSDTIAAVLRGNPDWSALPADLGQKPRDVLRRCLEKDPKKRYRDIGDVLVEVEEEHAVETPAEPSRQRWPWLLGLSGVVLGALGAGLLGFVSYPMTSRRPSGVEGAVRFALPPPSGGAFLSHTEGPLMAVSPDGLRIAFIASTPGSAPQIWVRGVDEIEPRAIAGTETAFSLFWSRDGRSIAFFSRAGPLRRVGVAGGAPVTIADLPGGIGRAGTWGAAEILFSSIQGEAIYQVSPDGGEPEVIIEPDPARGESRTVWPWFLPDGKAFLFLSRTEDGEGHLMLSRPGKASKEIEPMESRAQYVKPGFLVYVKEGVLLAQRFDAGQGRIEGAPIPLAPSVRFFLSTGWAAFATSPTGTLTYRSEADVMRLTWFDRSGRALGNVGSPGTYLSLAMSSDGKRVLFDKIRADLGTSDLWSLELARGIEMRLTSHSDTEVKPLWLPDGRSILYSTVRGGPPQLVRRDLAAESEERLLPSAGMQVALDVSPDGRTLLFAQRDATGLNLWTLRLAGDESRAPVAFLPSSFEQVDARFSPDGKWVAFISNESGRFEAYVVARDGRGEKVQVSREGTREVRWGRGGNELLYLSFDGRLFSVPVAAGPELRLGNETLLFQLAEKSTWTTFEVAPHEDRFLAIVTESSGDERPATVVLNWPALVER